MGREMRRKLLQSLDLFSGIGGLTVALLGVAAPVTYCDIDSAAQAVLADRIDKRLLPCAPVCTDVRELTRAELRAHNAHEAPEAIIAGFPCVGAWWASGRGTRTNKVACSGRSCGSWMSTPALECCF